MQKIFHFIKYNNATVIILAVVLILGGGALAAGPENIGQKQISVQGADNAALLAANFDNFSMDFKIENIQQDEKYYYVTYSFLDLVLADNVWQYQLSQKTQKVSKKIKEDIGVYMAKFMAKHYEARIRELKQEKSLAESQGEQKRIEVTEYSGLIGRTLDLAAAVFPGYEPVVKIELPTPENLNLPVVDNSLPAPVASGVDNLTKLYNDYVAEHPEVFNPPVDTAASSTPAITESPSASPEQDAIEPTPTPAETETPTATPTDSADSPQAITEPTTVDIIELPTPTPEPVVTPEPTPASVEPAQ